MVETRFEPEFVDALTDRRITIPQRYIERMSWVEGEKKQVIWFLMLMPGRFRLLSDAQIVQDQKLQEVRSAIVDGPDEIEFL